MMKKKLKHYLKTKLDYDPISFENEHPIWMHTNMEKSERKAVRTYLIVALAFLGLATLFIALIIYINIHF